MLNINVVGSKHKIPTGAPSSFAPFDLLVHGNKFYLVMKAIEVIHFRSYGDSICNESFKTLPGGKSFDAIFLDTSVWINLLKNKPLTELGMAYKNDIAISIHMFTKAHQMPDPAAEIAAVIIHELAHVNGARNNSPIKEAEQMVMRCGFYDQCDISVEG